MAKKSKSAPRAKAVKAPKPTKSANSAKSAKATKPRRSAGGLASVSTEALAAELRRRRSELPKLAKRAAALRAELAAVEARVAMLSGSAAPAAPARAPRAASKRVAAAGGMRAERSGKPTLAANIVAFLGEKGDAVARGEIVEEMAKRLGREANASLSVQVSATLRKLVDLGDVAQSGRGQYARATQKGSDGAAGT